MSLKLSSLSTEYVRVRVSAKENGVLVDPSSGPVSMAFTAPKVEPVNTDWVAGSWDVDGTTYRAQALVGPNGGKQLSDGIYDVWLRVTDNPEIPVRMVGRLVVT